MPKSVHQLENHVQIQITHHCVDNAVPLVSRNTGLLCLKTESAGHPTALKDWIGWCPNRVEILNRLVSQLRWNIKSVGAPTVFKDWISWWPNRVEILNQLVPQPCLKNESAGDPTASKDRISWCPSRVWRLNQLENHVQIPTTHHYLKNQAQYPHVLWRFTWPSLVLELCRCPFFFEGF